MAVEVKMPQMGESITEGTLVRWHKKKGELVRRDEILFEISTDKVDTEIPSPASGYLQAVLVPEGTTVAVNTTVCILDSEAAPAAASGDASAAAAPHGISHEHGVSRERGVAAERLSPAVRRLAQEHGIDLASIQGSGEDGRVTRRDIERFIDERRLAASRPRAEKGDAAPAAPQRAAPSTGAAAPAAADRLEPLGVMRRQIAEHMVASKRTAPHVSTVHEAEMSAVAALRQELKARWAGDDVKVTYLSFVVQATALALRDFPVINAAIEGEQVRYHSEVNIGIAVALDAGLIVPVLKGADRLGLREICIAVEDLASRARRKGLRPDDVRGGTFTITNPGVFGTLIGTPIIHQPQSAILCLGAVQKRVVVLEESDAIAVRPMGYLSLSFDHRLIDGAVADRFMASITRRLAAGEFRAEAER